MVNQTQNNYEATQNNQNLSPGDAHTGEPLEKDFSNGEHNERACLCARRDGR